MKLGQITAWGKSGSPEKEDPGIPHAERCLTLLVEGMALNMPEIDLESYKAFRKNVNRLSLQLPDRLPDDEKLVLIRAILQEFENYRGGTETVLRERMAGWRALAAKLFTEVMASLGPGADSPAATQLAKDIGRLTTSEEIQAWCGHLEGFLHPLDADGKALGLASLKLADRSTANDNAAGLRGGGSAVEHLKKIMDRGGNGFIALFRLSCLDVISQRFGMEAVQDCLMAVSAFLTASLHNDDAIFHWSDSSLLAILQGRPSEQILTAELQRIASQNRDSSINVAGRTIMLRIPLAFELTPIDRLRSAEDLFRLSAPLANKL
jgi:GGDEF domain-containing protein